ncbi:MAG TPA: hypothetical protein VMT36_00930 [Candidatus Saccharimonadia bacterium]|nr:hypothetical protein [Candidatus Saccharimonadia bacterium]
MTDFIEHRRRASDRAQERALRAAEAGDYAAVVMANAQVEEALRRRADWRPTNPSEPHPDQDQTH